MKNNSTLSPPARLPRLGSTDFGSMLSIQPLPQTRQTVDTDLQQYKLFWHCHEEGTSLHFFAPGARWAAFPEDFQYGYEIKFYEETLIMTGCRHFPFCSTAIHFSNQTSITLPDNRESNRIGQLIRLIAKELAEPPAAMRDVILSGLFKILVAYVSRHFECFAPESSTSEDLYIYGAFMNLLFNQHSGQMGIDDYAQRLKVDRVALTGAIRRVSGYSTRYHIHQRIVRSAKHAAITSRASMKEVALSLGFPDMAHFSKFFKNKAGLSFSDYKKAFKLV